MADTSTQGRTPATARRAGLDRGDVVDAALALVEAEGAGALTMRRLATELDVTTTTIYWHVGGRDEVVTALIGRLSERLAEREVRGLDPVSRIVEAARLMWDSSIEHRHVTVLAYQVGAASLLEFPLQVALVRELEAAGLRGVAVRDALRAIVMCVAGFLVAALRPEDSVPDAYRTSSLWAAHDDAAISAETLDALTHRPDLEALLTTTLRAVVGGVLSHAPEVP
jgi:TetR/AcrR family tetracycline transcriptional repressor